MGYKLSEKGINRRKVNAEKAFQKEVERFNQLQQITADSETYDNKSENWQWYAERGWRYSPEWKDFFAPPIGK